MVIFCALPSSRRLKSDACNPSMALPSLSRTSTLTTTRLVVTEILNSGFCPDAATVSAARAMSVRILEPHPHVDLHGAHGRRVKRQAVAAGVDCRADARD